MHSHCICRACDGNLAPVASQEAHPIKVLFPATRVKDPVPDPVDLVTLGETMANFVRDGQPDRFRVVTAGTESNVAAGLAQLGCRTRWLSRLGNDELGHFVAESISGHGVDVEVDWDPVRPTGVCVKEVSARGTLMRYYRGRSAARHLDEMDLSNLDRARWLHLTGVTPALSPQNREVVTALMSHRRGSARLSFDINYRPTLWPDTAMAAKVLVRLAQLADVVFIGEDEAQALLGTASVDSVAGALLQVEGQQLVFKRGAGAVTLVTSEGQVSEPANSVEVVDLVGAGDAFAAGYLAGSIWGWSATARLRLGHFLAARVISVTADIGPNIPTEDLARLASSLRQRLPRKSEKGPR